MPTEHYTTEEANERLADIEARLEALEADTPVPPDPIPEPEALIYGYSHTNRARLEADTGVYVAADRIFDKAIASSWAASTMGKLPTRYFPFYSFKPGTGYSWSNPNVAGFRNFIETVPRPTVVIPSHEPENDNSNPEKFKSQLKTYSEIVADVGNENVHLAICLMTSWADKSSAQGGSVAYIPDPSELACPVGLTWDGYQPAGKAGQTPEQIYAKPMDLTDDSGLAWSGIMETASETEAASWVSDVTDWAVGIGLKACLYWPSQTGEPGATDWYPPSSAFDEFAEVALRYGGERIASRYAS